MPAAAVVLGALLPAPAVAQAGGYPYTNDDDLYTFVSRPELKPPKLDVEIYEREARSPGYFFLAPYNRTFEWDHGEPTWKACVMGPAIYDDEGVRLVWSGACDYANRNVFDFRPTTYDGRPHVSLNVVHGDETPRGAGLILDDSYRVARNVLMSAAPGALNQHEFNVIDGGKTALFITEGSETVDGAQVGLAEPTLVRWNAFIEWDLTQEGSVFEWNALDYVPLNESTYGWPKPVLPDETPTPWDFLHMNSVEKFPDGDFLISARYTNSIMRVSRKDGSVLWRLGGKASDFQLLDERLAFSRQHDARVHASNSTHTLVSLLDNAVGSLVGDDEPTANASAGLFALLHHPPDRWEEWTASLARFIPRPDAKYTMLRGSLQTLPFPEGRKPAHHDPFSADVPALVCWSSRGYQTEYDAQGRIVAEARFRSPRLDTYRAYKGAWAGQPGEPIALVARAYSAANADNNDGHTDDDDDTTITLAHVSWNGATAVRAYRLTGRLAEGSTSHPIPLGEFTRTGFETAMAVRARVDAVTVEALDSSGSVLGRS
ncbi:uncharacterized protein K452DRAFT_223791, partial [Aplosporella prunicola CBS 121167]